MNEPQRQQTKVDLEDLLHLKRAERPTPAFWSQFEQEMRAKQLSALVQKDLGWRSWAGALTRSSRLHLPLGVTAVFALAIVSVREFRHPASSHLGVPLSPVVSPAFDSDGKKEEALVPIPAVDTQLAVLKSAPVSPAPFLSGELSNNSASSSLPEEDWQPQSALARGRVGPSELSPSARSIAENRAAAEASDSGLLQLDRSHGFENVFVSDVSSSVEPLTQVATPRDARRARLLASAVPTDIHSPEKSAARSRERVTSHLHEESLYDSISRLGLNGDRVSIKF